MSIKGSTFDGRIDVLIERVGVGLLVGTVEYDQAYAHRQHAEVGWQHPRGGQALYLLTPFMARSGDFMQNIANHVFDVEGPKLAMIENVEALARESSLLAPKEWGVLEGSAHPSVTLNGFLVYDRPPIWPRLPDEVLDQLHEIWSDMFPNPWRNRNKMPSYKRTTPIRIKPTRKPRA